MLNVKSEQCTNQLTYAQGQIEPLWCRQMSRWNPGMKRSTS